MTLQHNVSLDDNPLPVWICDEVTMSVLDVNQAAIRDFGYPHAEWINSFLYDRMIGLSKHVPAHSTVKIKSKLGDFHVLDIRTSPTSFHGIATRYIVGYPSRHSSHEEQLRNAMRFAKQGAAEYDVTRDEVTISDELLELLKAGGETVSNKLSLREFLNRYVLPDDHNFITSKIHKGVSDSIVSDTTMRLSFRVRTTNGEIRIIDALGTFKDGDKAYGILQDVSDQNRILDEPLEKSKQVDDILQSITDGFFAVDQDLNFTLVNPMFEALTRLKAVDIIGRNALDIFPNVTKSSLEQFTRALHTSRPSKFEFTNLANLDQIFDVHIYPSHSGLFVYFQDISDRKSKERRLVESENKLKAFFNSTTDVNFLLDPDYSILAYNRAAADFARKAYNITVREGESILRFISPETIHDFQEGFINALGGATSSRELEVSHNSELRQWWQVAWSPAVDGSGQINGVVFNATNITPLKSAIAELLKTQDLLRAIVENAPMDVFVKDQGGRYIFFNKSFEQKFPRSPVHEVLTDYDLFGADDVLKEQEQDLAVMRTGEIIREEERAYPKGKETYYTIKFPLFDNQQNPYAVGGIAIDFTQRRQMEKALRDSRERIGIALDAAQVCTWDWHIERNSIHWEGEVHTLLGFPMQDLKTYEAFVEILHPDDRQAFQENVVCTLQEKKEFYAEFRVIRGDGVVCWVMGAGRVLFDENQRPVRMVGINKDITERRSSEGKIRESEQRFRQMADNSPSFIWVSDPRGEMIYFNKAWYEFIGGTPETELGTGWQRHVHPEDAGFVLTNFLVSSEKKEPFTFEYRVRRKDGEYRWLMESGAPRYLEKGEFLGYIGSSLDVTERKKMEAALKNSESLYRSVIHTQREMICRYTPDWKLTFVNDAFCVVVGKSRDELIGRSLLHFLPREKYNNAEWTQKELTTASPLPERIVFPDGQMRWHEWTDHALLDQNGNVTEIQSVGNDVTERVESNLEVNRISTRLLLATHAANLGIWEWTVATDTSIWDRKMYEIFGLDPDAGSSPDEHWFSRIHPDDRLLSRNAIARAINGKSDYQFEYRIYKKGSGLRFLNSYGIVQYGPDAKATTIVGVTWDNTERKLSEIALQESEKRFRTLVQNLSVGIFVLNADLDVVLANQAIMSLMGIDDMKTLSPASIDCDWQLVREDGSPLPFEEHPAILALRTGHNVTNRIIGAYRPAVQDQVWLMVDAVPSHDETGMHSQVTVTCIDITGRVLAEKALHTKGRQMKALMDRLTLATTAAHLGIWDFNPATNELIWDNTMFQIYGKEPEVLSSLDTWLASLHPDEGEEQMRILHDAFENPDYEYNTEFRIIRESDKAVRHIKAFATISRDANHRPVQIVGVNWDITEQKQKEEEIRKSELRYRSIVDGQREMICRYTSSGALTFANKSYLDAFGSSVDPIHLSYLDLFSGSNRPMGEELINSLSEGMSSTDPIEFQTEVQGHKRWLKWINIPLRNSAGDVYEVQAIGQDITERKELEAQQARLDRIVRESFNEIYLFNADSLRFEFANSSALQNLGYDLYQLTELKVTDLFDHQPNEVAIRVLLNALRNGDTDRLQLQLKHRRKDGSYYDIETLIQVFEKDQSFVAIVTDITQKLVTEKKLLATIQEKETLIKEIHHRVKNNLQLISSIIYIKMASVRESEIQYFLGDMRQKIRSIALIHERLLQTENLDTVDISDYLGKLVKDLQTSNARQDLNLTIASALDNEQMDLDTAIYCALIVNELITNAIKHAFQNLSVGLIRVSFKLDKNEYVLAVNDNGVTMPASIGPGESNSFGMHLLEIFVRQLAGQLEVKRDGGTSFIIRFPKK